jgi:hypothetical protein
MVEQSWLDTVCRKKFEKENRGTKNFLHSFAGIRKLFFSCPKFPDQLPHNTHREVSHINVAIHVMPGHIFLYFRANAFSSFFKTQTLHM